MDKYRLTLTNVFIFATTNKSLIWNLNYNEIETHFFTINKTRRKWGALLLINCVRIYLRKKRKHSGKVRWSIRKTYFYQKQPPRVVLKKSCSENMQQIYRRTPMPKCDFNKIAFAFRHGCSPVNLQHIFRTTFLRNTSG